MVKLGTPDWKNARRVHDWRNHVPVAVRTIWESFSEEQKLTLFDWAEKLSDQEKWD